MNNQAIATIKEDLKAVAADAAAEFISLVESDSASWADCIAFLLARGGGIVIEVPAEAGILSHRWREAMYRMSGNVQIRYQDFAIVNFYLW